jgi:ATP-dependent helicase HrpB
MLMGPARDARGRQNFSTARSDFSIRFLDDDFIHAHFRHIASHDDALPQLTAALRANNAAVLVAPPGAGKTTRVPLVLLDEPWAGSKKILVLEPRRLAARAAAARMASTMAEQVGDTVGLRVRFGSKISKRTRIEVVTEGVFTRMVLDDPSLDGVAAVLFDEFQSAR